MTVLRYASWAFMFLGASGLLLSALSWNAARKAKIKRKQARQAFLETRQVDGWIESTQPPLEAA